MAYRRNRIICSWIICSWIICSRVICSWLTTVSFQVPVSIFLVQIVFPGTGIHFPAVQAERSIATAGMNDLKWCTCRNRFKTGISDVQHKITTGIPRHIQHVSGMRCDIRVHPECPVT